MSQTLGVTEANVRLLNGDMDPANYGLSSERLRNLIVGIAQNWVVKLKVPELWDLGVFTILAGSNEDSNAAVEYAKIAHIRCQETGRVLDRVTTGEYAVLVDGVPETTPILGEPLFYTLTEYNGAPIIRVYPASNVTRNYDALVSIMPTDATTSATVMPFSKHAMSGIESESAAAASLMMGAANRERLKIDDAAVAMFQSDAQSILRDELTRLGRMHDPSHVPAQVR